MNQTLTSLSWQQIRFYPGEVSQGKHRALRNELLRYYNDSSRPSEVALFSTPLLNSGEIHLFFSPEAADFFEPFIKHFRIRPCEKPGRHQVKVVLGRATKARNLI